MAALRKTYLIQRRLTVTAGVMWNSVPFQQGTRDYADGYVDAMDSLYPSDAHRIISYDKEGHVEVYRETRGRANVHTNS